MNRYVGFDRDFQRLRMPALVRAVRWWAVMCADGWCSFEDAAQQAMALACALDAGFLSEAAFDDLHDWLIDQLANLTDEDLT